MSSVPTSAAKPTADGRKIAFHSPVLRRRHFAPRYWSTWLSLGLLRVFAFAPLPVSRALGGALGFLMYAFNVKRRRVVRINLRLCFPDLGEDERERLVRRYYWLYGQSFTDVAHLAWSAKWRLRRMLHLRGIERYRELQQQGRTVILLMPHFVGLNFAGSMLAGEYPTFSIAKSMRNEVLDWYITRARQRFGGAVLTREQGLRPVVHALRQGQTFYYLPDEDLGAARSVFLPFFGIPAATLPTLGRLAELTDAVVIPTFVRLLGFARGYEVIFRPPLERFPSGDELKDATHMNHVFEEAIRMMPEQYMWTLKVFRTRPNNEPSLYA
ncbi:MAG TPA: lipid A biosynthesis acyltransferase [Burkholderiales bacterium]|nr:lipid A biosynthesis acyltransferase [Burkholderiales bacterium]